MSGTATPLAAYPTRPEAGVESAAVVRGNSIVRSLYSIKPKSGDEPIVWPDRLDDNGNLVADAAGLEVIRELNNIEASWAGTINNTSTARTGAKVQNNSHNITDMLRLGSYVWRVFGYGEGEESNIDKVHVDRLNEHIQIHKQDTFGAYRLAKYGQEIWVSGVKIDYNSQRNVNVFKCFAIRIHASATDTGDVDVQVPGSVAIPSGTEGITYYALALLDSPEILSPEQPGYVAWNKAEVISDHDVNSQFLVLARAGLNRVEVWGKDNNELVATHELSDPHTLAFTSDNTLTITTGTTVSTYSLGDDGGLQLLDGITPPAGLTEPVKVRVSPDGTKLLVTDGNRLNDTRSTATHRFYIFDAATGQQAWARGRQEDYRIDARVYDDKYCLINTKEFTSPSADTTAFASWHDDKHVWLGDIGNGRYQLVSIETGEVVAVVSWEGYHYALGLVANDVVNGKGKLLVSYKQWEVDLDLIAEQDITPDNGAYRLTHNYSLCWRAEYDDKYNRLAMPTKFTNGRTFAFLQHQRPVDPTAAVDFHLLLVEKTDLRVIYTDQKFPIGTVLEPDLSLTTYESAPDDKGVGALDRVLTRYTQPFAGYDANGVPQWGAKQRVWNTQPLLVSDPISNGVFPTRSSRSSNNRYLTYSIDVSYNGQPGGTGGRGTGNHGGIMEEDGTDFLSQFLPSTKRDYYEGNLPVDKFEDSNGTRVGGSYSYAVGDTFFLGANNEFWKGKATFDWKFYSDLGLMRGEWVRANRADNPFGPAPGGYATNSTRGDFVQHGNVILHFSTGEGGGGGPIVMRYRGFDTIRFERLPLSEYTPPADASTDPLAALPKYAPVEDGEAGLTIEPADSPGLQLSTGRLETDGTDLLADFDGSLASGTVRIPLSVPPGPWENSLVLRFTRNAFPQQPGELANLEYYDQNDRLISTTGRREITNDNCPLLHNGEVVGTRSTEAWRPYGYNPSPAKFGVGDDGRPYVEYADFARHYAAGPADPDADVFAPAYAQLTFRNAGNRSYGISLYQSRLTSLTTTTPIRMANTAPGTPPPADQRLLATLSAAGLAHYNAGGRVALYVELPTGIQGGFITLSNPSAGGGGSIGTPRDPLAVGDNLQITAAVTDASNTWQNGDLIAYGSPALQDAGAPPAVAGQHSSILVGTADVATKDEFSAFYGGGAWNHCYTRRNDGTSGWTRNPKG